MVYSSCCSLASIFEFIFGFEVWDLTRFSKKTRDLTRVVSYGISERGSRKFDSSSCGGGDTKADGIIPQRQESGGEDTKSAGIIPQWPERYTIWVYGLSVST